MEVPLIPFKIRCWFWCRPHPIPVDFAHSQRFRADSACSIIIKLNTRLLDGSAGQKLIANFGPTTTTRTRTWATDRCGVISQAQEIVNKPSSLSGGFFSYVSYFYLILKIYKNSQIIQIRALRAEECVGYSGNSPENERERGGRQLNSLTVCAGPKLIGI